MEAAVVIKKTTVKKRCRRSPKFQLLIKIKNVKSGKHPGFVFYVKQIYQEWAQ